MEIKGLPLNEQQQRKLKNLVKAMKVTYIQELDIFRFEQEQRGNVAFSSPIDSTTKTTTFMTGIVKEEAVLGYLKLTRKDGKVIYFNTHFSESTSWLEDVSGEQLDEKKNLVVTHNAKTILKKS